MAQVALIKCTSYTWRASVLSCLKENFEALLLGIVIYIIFKMDDGEF